MSKRSNSLIGKSLLAPALVAAISFSAVVPGVYAQDTAALVSAGRAGAFLSNLEAGQYDMTQLDKAAVENLLNNGYFAQNERDLRFLQDTLAKYDAAFQTFLNSYITGNNSLGSMISEASTTARVFKFDEIVTFVNSFNAAKLSIETQVKLLRSLYDSLPDGQTAAGGQQIPAPLRSEIAALADTMQAAIDQAVANVVESSLAESTKVTVSFVPSAEALADLEAANIKIDPKSDSMAVLRTYSFSDILALNFADRPSIFPPEVLMDIRQAAVDIRTGNDQHAEFMENFKEFGMTQRIVPYRNECGEVQNWRWTSDAEVGTCDYIHQSIVDYFYYRSHLRALGGVALGVFGINNYQERFASLDRFLAPTNALRELQNGIVTLPGEIDIALKSYRQYLDVVTERGGDLFDGDASVVANINAVINRARRGTTDLADVNAAVVKLLAADAYEESLLVSRGATKRERTDFFRARWFTVSGETEEERAESRAQARRFQELGRAFQTEYLASSGTSVQGSVVPGSIQFELQQISLIYNDVVNRQARAQEILAFVTAEENSGKAGEIRQQLDQDAGDFFDDLFGDN